jgi:hypothetical protein
VTTPKTALVTGAGVGASAGRKYVRLRSGKGNHMNSYVDSLSSDEREDGPGNWTDVVRQDHPLLPSAPIELRGRSAMKSRMSLAALIIAAAAVGGATQTLAPRAHAAPDPRVEYLYDVTVRRHYNFPDNNDALGYGYKICDQVTGGDSYARVIGGVKSNVTPSDEFAANYLVSNAVNLLCPEQIWQLRNSAAQYRPPAE